MCAKGNLLKYLEIKNEKKPDFYRKTGLSNGFLDKNEHISSKNLEIIISVYPDLNLYWLITGDGEMLLKNTQNEACISSNSDNVSRLITILQNTLVEKDKQIESLLSIIKQGKV